MMTVEKHSIYRWFKFSVDHLPLFKLVLSVSAFQVGLFVTVCPYDGYPVFCCCCLLFFFSHENVEFE